MKDKKNRSIFSPLWNHFTKKIVAGLVFVIPLALTVFILRWLFHATDGILSPVVEKWYGHKIPGIGFILTFATLYILGVFSTNFLGKKVVGVLNNLLARMPIVKTVYNTIKQIVDTVTKDKSEAFQKVVIVSLLGSEMKVLGFVTGNSVDKDGGKLVHVFLPTTPNPTSGYLEFLRPEQVTETKLTVEEAIKIILSGGVTSPATIE